MPEGQIIPGSVLQGGDVTGMRVAVMSFSISTLL